MENLRVPGLYYMFLLTGTNISEIDCVGAMSSGGGGDAANSEKQNWFFLPSN